MTLMDPAAPPTSAPPPRRIGQASGVTTHELLSAGLVTSEQVAQATAMADTPGDVIANLVASGAVAKNDLLALAARAAGLSFVDLAEHTLDAAATALLPAEFARRAGVLPVGFEGQALAVAVALRSVNDLQLKDDIARLVGRRVVFVLSAREDIEFRISQTYRAEGELADLTTNLVVTDNSAGDLEALTEVTEDAPVVRFVNLLITQAIADRASDIHIEATERDVRVRYRIDGVLRDAHRAPRNILNGVISRMKIMSDMDIAERRIPQDGRMSVEHQGKRMDLRVATLPTVWGEKIVCRVLDNTNTKLSLDDLGFSRENFERFERSYTKPYGMILVTGPTGSGKSTTLYSTLNILNQPLVNVITVEDPVEYRLPGINQVQTNVKAGLTFASALRSILRSDPDIVLIGEIRDHETAHIAVEASLTGHLVLSTLHTNDAPSAMTRLIEMGIEPFLVGSALDCVVAQRLCRALCPRCKQAFEPDPEELHAMNFTMPEGHSGPLYKPGGCTSCGGTGYKGRMALHEVMDVGEDIERLAVRRSPTEDIARVAREQGMSELRDDGWAKVLSGKTTIEEVLRVVG